MTEVQEKGELEFDIATPRRTYHLRAHSAVERNWWVRRLRRAVQHVQEGGDAGASTSDESESEGAARGVSALGVPHTITRANLEADVETLARYVQHVLDGERDYSMSVSAARLYE